MTFGCPWPADCVTVDAAADIHQLERPPHGTQHRDAPYDRPHRHNHIACVPAHSGWRHPDDKPYDIHECGPMWTHARNPIELMWPPPTAWRVLTTSAIAVGTRRARALIAASRFARSGLLPAHMPDIDDDTIGNLIAMAGKTGQRITIIRAIADVCARHTTPTVDQIKPINGIGPHIVDAYRVHVLRDYTPPFTNPVAATYVALRDRVPLPSTP